MIKSWLERFIDEILKDNKERYTVSGGMAVSGPIHIGKLRGEVIYPSIITRYLRNQGKEVRHIVIIYTQDPLKAKEPLVTKQFIEKWKGVRIINVEDPEGCHNNWVEHFYEKYEQSYEEFGITAEPIMTHEIYEKNERMKEAIKIFLTKRKEAREILNKYKGEKLAENWFPLKPLCKNCYNILTTKVISWEGEDVEYECNKCGYVGKSKINEGKLEWRAEWVALWYTFEVDVELYGKDHAAAGGSRDSCNELYEKLFNKMPPKGFAYEWISLVKDGKREPMGSSEGVSFDIDEWLRVGKPQALKYWYIVMKAKTHLDFDPSRTIPLIHEEYDKAERIYFNLEEPFAKDLKHDIIFSYIAANDFNPPKKIGLQIPYSLMAILVQILPKENKLEEMIRKLRRMKIINDGMDYEEERKLASYIEKVTYWVNKYAPANIKIKVQYEVPENIIKELMDNEVKMLKDVYNVIKNWEGEINKLETEIYNTIKANNIKPNQGFAILYKIILGKENGPRFVSLVQALEKDTILNILSKVFK